VRLRNRVAPAGSRGEAWRSATLLLLLTLAAVALHGYHPYVEDAAFYVPAVEKALDPALFPHGAEFFEAHGSATFFAPLIAGSVRTLHLPLETVLFLWQLLCVYVFLLGCWLVLRACFETPEGRWGGVALVAALLTLPAGGTTMLLLDQYLNARSLSTCAGIFAVALALRGRYFFAFLLLLAAALVHPLMPVYTVFFLLLFWWTKRNRAGAAAVAGLLPFGLSFDPPSAAYHQAALLHRFHYVQYWAWYDWLGLFGPLVLFISMGRVGRVQRMLNVELLCRALVPYLLCCLGAALVLDLPARFEALARLQPMRSLHLGYILMFLLLGGMLGQFILQRKAWRWLLLFVPLSAGAAGVQLWAYPASAHVEWPGAPSRNDWVQAFVWIRNNTPQDAYFALNPRYLDLPGEDGQNFRAVAERSMLADWVKDSGAASMFPGLAEEWWAQVSAQEGWKNFRRADFQRLQERYGVNWVVMEQPASPGLVCPFQNRAVLVCRVE